MDWTTIVAVGVLVVVLIWGPQKIPDLARSLGRARREFEQASKGVTDTGTQGGTEGTTAEPIVEVARRLGIDTVGKTRQQISDEIVKSASTSK